MMRDEKVRISICNFVRRWRGNRVALFLPSCQQSTTVQDQHQDDGKNLMLTFRATQDSDCSLRGFQKDPWLRVSLTLPLIQPRTNPIRYAQNTQLTNSLQSTSQIQELKDLFSMLDKDNDSTISEKDLKSILQSLHQDTSPTSLKHYFSLLNPPVDFPAFMTYITSLKSQLSSREDIVGTFTSFDEGDNGYVDFEELKTELMTSGPKRMGEEDVESVLGRFVEKTGKNKGKVAYNKFLDAMMAS